MFHYLTEWCVQACPSGTCKSFGSEGRWFGLPRWLSCTVHAEGQWHPQDQVPPHHRSSRRWRCTWAGTALCRPWRHECCQRCSSSKSCCCPAMKIYEMTGQWALVGPYTHSLDTAAHGWGTFAPDFLPLIESFSSPERTVPLEAPCRSCIDNNNLYYSASSWSLPADLPP